MLWASLVVAGLATAKAIPDVTSGTETALLHAVPQINLTQYLGKWYQVYDNLLEQASFENHSYCDTAQYTAQADGTIGVRNWERQYNSTGPVRVIGGWAKCPQGKPPACTVHLSGVPVPAPYYIVALGPVLEQTYQWAVVSDPFGASLFVLARDPDTFLQQYNADVLQYLQANGFEGLKAPLRIVHKSDCNYQWGN